MYVCTGPVHTGVISEYICRKVYVLTDHTGIDWPSTYIHTRRAYLSGFRPAQAPHRIGLLYATMTSGFRIQCLHPTIFHVSFVLIIHPYITFWTLNLRLHPPPFLCFYCFHKPDPSTTDSIYTALSLHPFNCTRNSPHRQLTKCRSYRLENLWIQIPVSRRCPDFLCLFGVKKVFR